MTNEKVVGFRPFWGSFSTFGDLQFGVVPSYWAFIGEGKS
jgi:hypothetical protein